MLVLDTSCYLNGQRDHFTMAVTPGIWVQVGEAITDWRIILPRAVYREVEIADVDVSAWLHSYQSYVQEPSQEVQRRAGVLSLEFDEYPNRNGADPFVLAEAEVRNFTVSTYEGRSFSGVPTRRWQRSMPGVCQHFGIPCCTFSEALARLGISL